MGVGIYIFRDQEAVLLLCTNPTIPSSPPLLIKQLLPYLKPSGFLVISRHAVVWVTQIRVTYKANSKHAEPTVCHYNTPSDTCLFPFQLLGGGKDRPKGSTCMGGN